MITQIKNTKIGKYSVNDPIPIFEVSIDNLPDDDFIINDIDWEYGRSLNQKRVGHPFYDVKTTDTDIIQRIANEIDDEYIFKLFDAIKADNNSVFNYWAYDWNNPFSEFCKNNIHINKSLIRDSNEVKLNPHFDCRQTFATMIINLVDNETATQFFDFRNDNKLMYTAPTKKGEGVLWINNEFTLHGNSFDVENPYSDFGLPRERFRYAILVTFMITIK
jgi:hypothetical protein